MTLLALENLSVDRGKTRVVDGVNLSVQPGELVGLIGPNGAGKTTLMRAALGLLKHQGSSSLSALSPAARAHHVAWLPQAREIAWPMSVERVVALGRLPHLPVGKALSAQDDAAITAALNAVGLSDFRTRTATELSGGEQARVLIARTLAQDTGLVMADEPVAGLDPAAQIATLQSFQALTKAGKSVLVSLHDLGLAARHCTRLLMLHNGRLYADGAPLEVLSADNLRTVFGLRAHLQETEDGILFHPLEVLA